MRLVILGAGKLLIHILKNVDFSVYKIIKMLFCTNIRRINSMNVTIKFSKTN